MLGDKGVPCDVEEAFRLVDLAAAQGHRQALRVQVMSQREEGPAAPSCTPCTQ